MGVVPLVPTIYEVLEELAITVQSQLTDRLPLPFCAFNGGADVFCDLGNKCACAASPPSRCCCAAPARLAGGVITACHPFCIRLGAAYLSKHSQLFYLLQ